MSGSGDVVTELNSEETYILRDKLLSLVFSETRTKLQIFQRGLRLNVSVPLPPKRVKRKTTSNSVDGGKEQGTSIRDMPDEKVLNAIKLDKELDTLLRIFTAAHEEAKGVKSNQETLEQTVLAFEKSDNEVDVKTHELRQKQAELVSLKSQIETERSEAVKRTQNMDERISTLRHNLRNIRRLNDLEFELVQRWEANRYTQASVVCANEEQAMHHESKDLDRRLIEETRIKCEVEKFNSQQFEEFREKIAEWKTKYANEMAKVTAETVEHEKRIMELVKIRERHEQTYAERIAFVRQYLEQKEEEQRLYEQQMHRVACAVKIQSWWRGVMVRRGLGPYKKKVKKGKKGKGKAK